MLDQQEAGVQIGTVDPRRREARSGQRIGNGHEGRHVLGEMGDAAVGQAVADGRAVGLARSVHDHQRLAVPVHRLVAAAGGIAAEAAAGLFGAAGFGEEAADRQRTQDAGRRLGIGAHMGGPAAAGGIVQRDRHRGRGQRRRRVLRPFDEDDAVPRHLLEAELVQFVVARQAVEVEMRRRRVRLVGLHQRVGRRRHLELRVVSQGADRGACQRRLAGAQIADQRDHVACRQRQREVAAEPQRGGFVGQRNAGDLHELGRGVARDRCRACGAHSAASSKA